MLIIYLKKLPPIDWVDFYSQLNKMATTLASGSGKKEVSKFRPLKPWRDTLTFAKKFNAIIYKEAIRHLEFIQKTIFNGSGKSLEFMTIRKYINTLRNSTDVLVLETAFSSYSDFKSREKKEVLTVLADIERQIVAENVENEIIVDNMTQILNIYMPKDILRDIDVNTIVSDNIAYFRKKLIENRDNINKIFIMLWIYEQKLLKTPARIIRSEKDKWMNIELL